MSCRPSCTLRSQPGRKRHSLLPPSPPLGWHLIPTAGPSAMFPMASPLPVQVSVGFGKIKYHLSVLAIFQDVADCPVRITR